MWIPAFAGMPVLNCLSAALSFGQNDDEINSKCWGDDRLNVETTAAEAYN
jgi:hypothetical protein